MTARTSAFMNPPIEVAEKLYGNWSCEMSSWDALHELVVNLQTTGSSALAVSRGDEFFVYLYSDQQRVAVNVWGPEGETYFGAKLASVPPHNELYAIELERNEEFPEDGCWVMVPPELMLSADAAIDVVRRLSENVIVPSTLVATL